MSYVDDFQEYYNDELLGIYDCPDRIVCLAYNQYVQTGGGFRNFWRALHGGDESKLNSVKIADMAGDMSRRIYAFCQTNNIPLEDMGCHERKGDASKKYFPSDPFFKGLFLVQKSLAFAPVWHVERRGENDSIIKLYHLKKWPRVRQFFFHIMDPEWGHVTIRMCAHPPFGAMVILNGHNKVERTAAALGLKCRMDGNCFIEGSDLNDISVLGNDLADSAMDIQNVADRWIYTCCLCFGLSKAEQELTRFKYNYSVFQMEYSRNYVFKSGAVLDQVYQSLLDRSRRALGLEQIRTILGFKRRPHGKLITGIERSRDSKGNYDLTTLTIIWGGIKLKIYDKSARLLRAEVTVNNAKVLRCKRSLSNIPEIMGRLREMLVSFMSHVQAVNIAFIGPDDAVKWSEPSVAGGQRTAGINLYNARARLVLSLLPLLSTAPDGFSSADLQKHVIANGGPHDYTINQSRYDLRKMRVKGLVCRPKKRRKFKVPVESAKKVCAYFTINDEVVKPVIASCGHRKKEQPREPTHPADVLKMRMQDTLDELFKELGIKAA